MFTDLGNLLGMGDGVQAAAAGSTLQAAAGATPGDEHLAARGGAPQASVAAAAAPTICYIPLSAGRLLSVAQVCAHCIRGSGQQRHGSHVPA